MAKVATKEAASAVQEDIKVAGVEQGNELSIPPSMMDDVVADSGIGFENVTTKDIAIPYYGILQALSPQVKKGPKRIDGAEEGFLFNTVSQQFIDGEKGIIVIPCAFLKAWVEWVPRDKGGGFVKQHLTEDIMKETRPTENEDGKISMLLPNGNNIVDTAYHYVMRVHDNGALERAIISMTSTQLKKSRRWLAVQMNIQIPVNGKMINPPPFSHTYHLTTIGETKNDNSWFGWNIGSPKFITEIELYRKARAFAMDIRAGQVEIPPPPSDEHPDTDDTKTKGDAASRTEY